MTERRMFEGLDEGAIDAPTVAGRLVQTAILLVRACSEEWRDLPAGRREALTFEGYVTYSIVEAAKGTLWETEKRRELLLIVKAAGNIASKHGPVP